jgi:GGDEF domain-containing protein
VAYSDEQLDEPSMHVGPKKSGIWKCDLPTEKLTWTAHTYDLFGLKPESEIRRRDIIDMYADGCRERVQVIRAYAIRTKKGFTVDVSIWTPAAEKKWLRVDGQLLMSHFKSPRLLGTKQDITDDHLRRLHSRNLIGHDAITGLPLRESFDLRYAEIQDHGGSDGTCILSIELMNRKAILVDHGRRALEESLFEIAGQIARIVGAWGAAFVLDTGIFAVIVRSAEQSIVGKLIENLRILLNDPVFADGILLFPQIKVQLRSSAMKSSVDGFLPTKRRAFPRLGL